MLTYSIDIFLSHELINSVILVVPQSMYQFACETYIDKRIHVVTGGDQRWQSVSNGVNCSDAEWVMIHDAARPFVTNSVIDSIIQKLPAFECVITVTPEVDTIRMFEGEKAGATINRETLVRVGTPQLFRRNVLCKGLSNAAHLPVIPTDEAVLMQNMGITVGIAWGDPKNFKITTPSDLEIAEALIARNKKMLLDRE